MTDAARSIQKWMPKEESLLASAWVGVSEHPIIGLEQTKDAIWDHIEEKFFAVMNKDALYCTRDQLTSKCGHSSCKVRKFIGVCKECSRSRKSGTNDADVLPLATTRYQDDGHQGKVPVNLWRILSRSPKWQELNNPEARSSNKRSSAEAGVDDTVGSFEQRSSFNVDNFDDKDPIPRPIGRKKAKFITSGSGGSNSVSSHDDIGRAMIEQLQVFNIKEEERERRKQQKEEIEVIETDHDMLSGFKCMIFERRQKEINAKYNFS
ncbi:unnamed protein product [Cuscuta campestris]|uniref:No apical meristem-associated C-terminal domain-containing protein n=1 Tax=Cuscuta campestris TaxID=132261 RepID=A0A484M1U5_9ASTE|nr:unnamed protein product [Cuscuta campestris]